ncbi:hypothetical protein VTK73DRAFT_8021 [Phialemonium thermophilum]|uniref:Rhodopsin domain-containing protein n=1 Tax=Phialemonium thermophilum TaxID=223376 RepID=A0ABR3WBA8_9PEZI
MVNATDIENHKKLTSTVVPLAPRSETGQIIHTAIIFSVLIAVWSALRLYAKRMRGTPLQIEDGLFYISVVAFYGMIVALFLALYLGAIGYHMDQLEKKHVARLTQSVLAIQGLYGLAMCASKWSILWMLKRIFAVRSFQLVTWAIIVVQAAWMIMTVLIGLLICRPIQKNWDPTVSGQCGNQIAGYTAVSVYNVIVDVVMCILPIPMIYNLQVKKPYKAALLGIFGIGVVTVVFSILRLVSLRSVDFNDFAFTVPDVIIWTYAETGVVLLVACSPLLRPIFDKVFRPFLSITRSKSERPSHGGSIDYLTSGNGPSQQPKIKSKRRSGFVTVGDSEESLELGDVGERGRTHTNIVSGHDAREVGPRRSRDRDRDRRAGSADNGFRMGIVVEKEVSQTVNLVNS